MAGNSISSPTWSTYNEGMARVEEQEVAEHLYALVRPHLHEDTQEIVDSLREEGRWDALINALSHAARVHGIPVQEPVAA